MLLYSISSVMVPVLELLWYLSSLSKNGLGYDVLFNNVTKIRFSINEVTTSQMPNFYLKLYVYNGGQMIIKAYLTDWYFFLDINF